MSSFSLMRRLVATKNRLLVVHSLAVLLALLLAADVVAKVINLLLKSVT